MADSLKIISDINEHITALDAKIEKTSKSASVAFAYLYSRIGEINEFGSTVNKLNESFSYVSYDVAKANINSYAYFVSLKGNVTDISNTVYDKSKAIDVTVSSIEDRLSKLESNVDAINVKLEKILECPEKYMVVKKEPPMIIKFFLSIHNLLYRTFHWKSIKKAEEEAIKKEQERIEQAERDRIERERQRAEQERKEKEDKLNKIKGLLG